MGVIYRPPGTEMQIFNENISSLLNALKNENKYCYLMGDYNVNLLNYGKHKETSEFVNLFHSYSFISLINKPTRLVGQNATLIDNIFTNCFNHLENTFQCLIVSDVSDHCPIIHVDYSSDSVKREMYVTRRNMSAKQTSIPECCFCCGLATDLQWNRHAECFQLVSLKIDRTLL